MQRLLLSATVDDGVCYYRMRRWHPTAEGASRVRSCCSGSRFRRCCWRGGRTTTDGSCCGRLTVVNVTFITRENPRYRRPRTAVDDRFVFHSRLYNLYRSRSSRRRRHCRYRPRRCRHCCGDGTLRGSWFRRRLL